MCEHAAHKDLAPIKVYHSYEAVLIATDIENDFVANFIGRWECIPQFIPGFER